MLKRTAVANKINLNALTYSAVFNIGDTKEAKPRSKAFAVQKEGAFFRGDDGIYFNDYSLFKRKTNWPKPGMPVKKNTLQHHNTIQVDNVKVTGISQTAIFQVGSIESVRSESRIKHMRLYLDHDSHKNHSES